MVTASAGLEKGVILPTSPVFVCNGGLRMGRFFGCWGTHGPENLMQAMAHSCDVYFYQTSLLLGNSESSGPNVISPKFRASLVWVHPQELICRPTAKVSFPIRRGANPSTKLDPIWRVGFPAIR